MKCAYCGDEMRYDPYQGLEGVKHTVRINGVECEVEMHCDCVDACIGEHLSNRKIVEE